METAMTMVRLRWALTWAAMRKSAWQTVNYVISLMLGLALIVGTAFLAWFLGIPAFGDPTRPVSGQDLVGPAAILQVVVVIFGSFLTLFIGFIQLMIVGEGSTMSPHRFELYGIADRRLQMGLVLSGLSGIPAITGTLALLLWSMAYRWMGIGVVVCAVVAAPLAIITMMSIAKLLISSSTTLVTSKRGRNAFYLVAMVAFIVVCQLPNLLLNSQNPNHWTIAGFSRISAILAWTPFGAAFQLPFDVAAGNWFALVVRVLVLALTWVLCFMGCTWCLRHERLTVGAHTQTVTAKGIGAFAWMPDSVSGAVSARLLTYLKRDPRQALFFLMPIVFLALFAFESHGFGVMVWMALIIGGLFMSMTESNGLAYDGRGFTMQAISGVSGRDDRHGRVRVYATIWSIYLMLLAIAACVITGDWRTPGGLRNGFIFLGIAFAVAFCGLGLAEVISCVLMYPVPSMDKPFSSPQGRALAQGFMPFVFLFGTMALVLPTGIVALVLALSGNGGFFWLLAPVGLLNGIVVLIVGSVLGGRVMDARLLNIVNNVDRFASLQK